MTKSGKPDMRFNWPKVPGGKGGGSPFGFMEKMDQKITRESLLSLIISIIRKFYPLQESFKRS